MQRVERKKQFDRLVRTIVEHADRHRCHLDEEADIENRARMQRGLPRVTSDALIVRLAVEEVIDAVPTNQLRGEDFRSAVRKARFRIAAGTHRNADDSSAIAVRSYPSGSYPVQIS